MRTRSASNFSAGANVQQWECHLGDSQLWRALDVGGGFHKLANRRDGVLVLDVEGTASGSNGANIQLATYDESADMKWQLATAEDASEDMAAGGASGETDAGSSSNVDTDTDTDTDAETNTGSGSHDSSGCSLGGQRGTSPAPLPLLLTGLCLGLVGWRRRSGFVRQSSTP